MSVRLVSSSPILHAWAKTVGARAQTGQSGRQGQLEGKIQERYGIAKDQARKDVDNLVPDTAVSTRPLAVGRDPI